MYKINLWLLVRCTFILLSAFDKKEDLVDYFKSNKQLLSEYISKFHSKKKAIVTSGTASTLIRPRVF